MHVVRGMCGYTSIDYSSSETTDYRSISVQYLDKLGQESKCPIAHNVYKGALLQAIIFTQENHSWAIKLAHYIS